MISRIERAPKDAPERTEKMQSTRDNDFILAGYKRDICLQEENVVPLSNLAFLGLTLILWQNVIQGSALSDG